jgi:hypothetical protein
VDDRISLSETRRSDVVTTAFIFARPIPAQTIHHRTVDSIGSGITSQDEQLGAV